MASISDLKLRALAPRAKPFKHAVGEGLYLTVLPSGVKSWRSYPRLDGRRQTISYGVFPDELKLAEARDAHREAMKQVKSGLHPTIERRKAVAKNVAQQASTYNALFDEWFSTWAPKRSNSWSVNNAYWHRIYIAPRLGALPLADIEAPMVLEVMRSAERAVSLHCAHDCRRLIAQVLDHGVALGACKYNIARSLTRALPRPEKGAHASMTLEQARATWSALDEYEGTPTMRLAMQLLLLSALRVSEVAFIERSWVDDIVITIPRSAMKMKNPQRGPFVLPLSTQAKRVVREALGIDGSAKWLFPGFGTRTRPLSRTAFNQALSRAMPGVDISPHSVRNCLSTWAHDNEVADESVIEAALDHARGSAVSRAYNRATLLTQRAKLMQRWADVVTFKGPTRSEF